MLKKTITYTDFDGNERTEDFYFNLSKAEVIEMETKAKGGLSEKLKRIVETQNTKQIIKIFKDIILKSYGEKSPDGKKFVKSKKLSDAFSQTEAFDNLFTELATDSVAAEAFIKAIIPDIPNNGNKFIPMSAPDVNRFVSMANSSKAENAIATEQPQPL